MTFTNVVESYDFGIKEMTCLALFSSSSGLRAIEWSFFPLMVYDRRPRSNNHLPSFEKCVKMADDGEADPSLLTLLRESLGITNSSSPPTLETGVLTSAEYVCNNAIDVAIDCSSTKTAAATIYNLMQSKQHSIHSWSAHELHPQGKDEATLNFIFTMDLLNFSFWSEKSEEQRFAVEYRGRKWTGYWSLVACLQRAVDEGMYIFMNVLWQPPAGVARVSVIYLHNR